MIRGEMIYLHEAQLESIPDMHVVTGELMLNHICTSTPSIFALLRKATICKPNVRRKDPFTLATLKHLCQL
jgi:hypothetical protein